MSASDEYSYYENGKIPERKTASSGELKFNLPGIEVDGIFVNGNLVSGKFTINKIIYEGKFNANGYLEGNGSITIDNIKYEGMYKNGDLLEGSTFIDGAISESGVYTYVGSTKKPHLCSGTKWKKYSTESGLFDNFGNLVKGTIVHDNGDSFTGVFNNTRLINGTTLYNVGQKVFSATYKLVYDPISRIDIFEYCEVKWDGTICELPQKLLAMLCCQGKTSSCSYKFFLRYLYEYDGSAMCYLQKALFKTLSSLEEISLDIILENLAKYPDYRYAKYVRPGGQQHKPQLRRSVSVENAN